MNLIQVLQLLLCKILSCPLADSVMPSEDSEKPLFLTPFVKNGSLDLARELSWVNLTGFADNDNINSYSGYLTVNETHNSNLFFWFFPSVEARSDEAPLLIWLQGGPGQSSLFGLFYELGPFSLDEGGEKISMNPHSWNEDYNLLFIDNPIGAGFSFTDAESGYVKDQNTIGEHLYSALVQFVQIYPSMAKVPLYICGESYGGKHTLSLAHQIIVKNSTADLKINLEGIAIGNGYIDPVMHLPRADLLYNIGLMDENERQSLKSLEDECIANSTNGDLEALRKCDEDIVERLWATDIPEINNFVEESPYDFDASLSTFARRIRSRLHVGDVANFEASFARPVNDLDDFMASARPWLEEALDAGVRAMLYSGQYDLNVPYTAATAMYRRLEWSGREEYLEAKRKHWLHDGVLAGHIKRSRNFIEVLVRNAGHMVPVDQPERMLALMNAFIRNYDGELLVTSAGH